MTSKGVCTAVVAVLLWACPPLPRSATAPALKEPTQESSTYRSVARELADAVRAQDEALWRHWTQGAPLDLRAAWSGHEQRVSVESVKALQSLAAEAGSPRETRVRSNLLRLAAGEYLARGVAPEAEALAAAEATTTFRSAGKVHAWRDLSRLLAAEPSRNKRLGLSAAATEAVVQLSPLFERRDRRLRELIATLGAPSYEAYSAQLRDADLDALEATATELLAQSQPAYVSMMDGLARRELGIGFDKLHRADLPRLFQTRGVDGSFPKDQLWPRVERTLADVGLPVSQRANLRVDTADSPHKNGRPLVVAVSASDDTVLDVRLSVRPLAGATAQMRALHEVGRALRLAYASRDRFELARLGDESVSDAFGWLFEGIGADPAWLTEVAAVPADKVASYQAALAARRLLLLRRSAGTFLFERALERQSGQDPRRLFREHLGPAYGVSWTSDDDARWRSETDELFACAQELKAALLAGSIESGLRQRFGSAWWRVPEAGAALTELWASTTGASGSEVAARFGAPAPSSAVVLAPWLELPAGATRVPVVAGPGADGGVMAPPRSSTDAGEPPSARTVAPPTAVAPTNATGPTPLDAGRP